MASLTASTCHSSRAGLCLAVDQHNECRSDPYMARYRSHSDHKHSVQAIKKPLSSSSSSSSSSKSFTSSKSFSCSAFPPSILRFPPNFARQLSIKARRNCSNIGLAQVVAASATNHSPPPASTGVPDNGAGPITTLTADPVCSSTLSNDATTPSLATAVVHAGLLFHALNFWMF